MDTEQQYITAEKKEELQAELAMLTGTKRKEIMESLEFAKSLGDLSENAEYHQAREAQGKLEDRIMKVESILKSSVLIDKHHSTKVEVGATITVQKVGEPQKITYTIVGSEEVGITAGKISNNSPLGVALLGKKKGDIASFQSPKGAVQYKVLDIE